MYERFVRAAAMDYETWHDGRPHDLDAIRAATESERRRIEQFLLGSGPRYYRDVEALAVLNTPAALDRLRAVAATGAMELRAAVARLAPHVLPTDERLRELLERIAHADAYEGLDLTLRQVEETRGPAVVDAMLDRIAREPGLAAVHYAAMLLYLHGHAAEPFDWEQRPFFLRFNPGDLDDRKAAMAELCRRIGVDPSRFPVRRGEGEGGLG